jgi:uncharacterized protein (DUF2141 family)
MRAVLFCLVIAAYAQARDVAPRLTSGTGLLTGIVVTENSQPTPVRNAIVTLNHVDRSYGDTVVTDDRGRFQFIAIPAGRYLVSALKEGFIRTRYGASRPGRAGTPIAIVDGQPGPSVTLRLARGAVLTGRVTTEDGEPVERVEIDVKQFVSIGGERRLDDATFDGHSLRRTDDRGVYRIFGLPAGEYIVVAVPNFGFHEAPSGLLPTTAADVRWARAQLQGAAGASRPESASIPVRPLQGYAPVYFPNTYQKSSATVIPLTAGEERSGLDITLQLAPTWRVDGVVTTAGGGPPSQSPSTFLVDVSGNSEGFSGVREGFGSRFTFDGVAPGQYMVAAMIDDTNEWATSDLIVGGQNASVSLVLQPALTVSGRLSFQGTTAQPADLTRIRMSLNPSGSTGAFNIQPPPATVKADGTFTLRGLLPGRYRLWTSLGAYLPGATSSWSLRSAMVGDQDISDIPIEVRAGGGVDSIVVTFTDRPTELSGRLQDASGRAAADYFIIVFSSDQRTWLKNSRRIAQTRPASDGQFVIRGLPPGEYLLAALTDVENDEWFDQAFLRQLVPGAMKVSLGEGETKVQDVGIRK